MPTPVNDDMKYPAAAMQAALCGAFVELSMAVLPITPKTPAV